MKASMVRPIVASVAALVVNMLLFLFIPFLSHITAEKQPETLQQAFTFNNLRHAPPPPPPPPKEPLVPKQLPQNMTAVAALGRVSSPAAPKMPMVPVTPPQFDLAPANLDLGANMVFSAPISAPQSEFNISEVDATPQVIARRDPVYPYQARQKNLSGIVVLKFIVTPEGTVERISVVQSNPPGVFDDAAIQAISDWRFKPGILDGDAVSTWMSIPLKFQLQ